MLARFASLAVVIGLVACSGSTAETPAPAPAPAPAKAKAKPAPITKAPKGPVPSLIVSQAWFKKTGGKMQPQPAKMVLYRMAPDGSWHEEIILDKDSNVFHKAMPWRDGILTIGAMKAMVKHWTRGDDGTWTAKTLWEQSWGGKFDRFRDVEFVDLDGDGKEEMALATHDMGVVAVGTEAADGTWSFQEMDKTADIFVHEVEVGDLEGDGKMEFYVTPSERNKSSGVSQPGGVARYQKTAKGYAGKKIVWWDESHAKEILVTDTDGDGKDELYVVKEGHVVKEGGKKVLKDPVTLVRMDKVGKAWKETVVATIPGEKQTRFIVPGDVDGDGKIEIVAAGMDTGVHVLQPKGDGTFEVQTIEENSGGFEHATHVADLDNDGKLEIYVAADKQRQLRRYVWNGTKFERTKIADLPRDHITWNIQDGVF